MQKVKSGVSKFERFFKFKVTNCKILCKYVCSKCTNIVFRWEFNSLQSESLFMNITCLICIFIFRLPCSESYADGETVCHSCASEER